jgi:hypothetical protein
MSSDLTRFPVSVIPASGIRERERDNDNNINLSIFQQLSGKIRLQYDGNIKTEPF